MSEKEVSEYLRSIGHTTSCFDEVSSIVQGIERSADGYLYAYSDPRKGGKTDGV
jgi:hypothetical protein